VSGAWRYVVRIADIYEMEAHPFEQKRDLVVERVKASDAMADEEFGETLTELIEELGVTDDPDEFDSVMDSIWDLGDTGKFLWLGP